MNVDLKVIEKMLEISKIRTIYVRDISDFYFCKRKLKLRKLFPVRYEAEGTVKVGKILHHLHFLLHKYGESHVLKATSDYLNNLQPREQHILKEALNKILKTHQGIMPNKKTLEEVPISYFSNKLKGKIDLIINDTIYEVKFYWNNIQKPFLSDKLQAFTYGFLMKLKNKYNKNYVVIEYPLLGLTFKVDLDDLELFSSFKQAISQVIEFMFTNELPERKQSKKCMYCEVKNLCQSL